MLEQVTNDIYVLDTFQLFHELYTLPQLAEDHYPRSTGEVNTEDLLYFYEHFQRWPLKEALRHSYAKKG